MHGGPWTERDLLALPDDGQRHELVEGRLLVSPPPAGPHQQTVLRLAGLLLAATPPNLDTVEGLGVRVPGGSILVPDLLVADLEAVSANRSGILDPGSVHLVVEIVSPGSVIMDRLTKPVLYAQAEIPSFWRVELGEGGPSIATFRLEDGGGYVAEAASGPSEPLVVAKPFPVRIDAGALAPGRLSERSR